MAYLLTNLIQDAAIKMGRSVYDYFTATGGSTTTVVCTTMSDRIEDDDVRDAIQASSLIVTRDVAGASAAPEGEMYEVGSYSQTSYTFTIQLQDLMVATGTFADSTGWTTTTGWTISGNASHTTGNTGALSGTTQAKRAIQYQVNFTLATSVAGDGLTVTLGGGTDSVTYTSSGSYSAYITPSATTGTLVFTPGAAGTWVGTIDNVTIYQTFTAAVAAGDEIMYLKNQYPLHIFRKLANQVLKSLGELDLPYTGITTVATDTEYDLPVSLKYSAPLKIDIYYQVKTTDSDDNQWSLLPSGDYYISPAAGGTAARIIFRYSFPASHTLKIVYRGFHPDVYDFDDVIHETIPQELIATKLALEVFRWYGINKSNRDEVAKLTAEYNDLFSRFPQIPSQTRGSGLMYDRTYSNDDYDFTYPDPA